MSYSSTHVSDNQLRFYWGVRINLASTPVAYTNAPFSITSGGIVFSPSYSLRVNEMGQIRGALGDIGVEIGNADGVIGVLAQALVGKYRFPFVTVSEFWFDASDPSSTTVQDTVVLTFGRMESPSWDESRIRFRVASMVSSSSSNVPYKSMTHTCPLINDYKGEQCGASDASHQTCAGSFTDCSARSNTARFGGFRHAPSDGDTFYFGQDGSFVVGNPPGVGNTPGFDPNR